MLIGSTTKSRQCKKVCTEIGSTTLYAYKLVSQPRENKNVDKLQRKYLPGVEEGRWGQAQYKDVRFRVII